MCGLPFIPTLTSRRAADAHDDGPRSCRRAERQQGFSTSRLAQPPARHRLQSKPTRPAVLTIAAAQPPPTCGCGWSCAATGCIWRCVTPAPGCCGWLPPTLTPRGAAGCGWSSSSPPPGGSTATPTAARSSGAPSSFNHPGEFYPRAVICEARPRRRRSESGWTHRRVACSFPDAMGLSPGSCPWSSAAWRRQGLLRIGAGETNIA
jgi:hypothetical protein